MIENLPSLDEHNEYPAPSSTIKRVARPMDIPDYSSQGVEPQRPQYREYYQRADSKSESLASSSPLNCIDVANHIQDCPICSRIYSSDKSIYIIVIIILAVACMILLRKVLDK